MIGDSDIDEEKATKIEYYDKTLPIFLSDPNYYFNSMDSSKITKEELERESEDEIIVRNQNE